VPFYFMSWPDWPTYGDSPSSCVTGSEDPLPAMLSEEGKKPSS